jgi:hypothetical protein
MNNHKVPAQSLICWLRQTQKCEKSDFGEVKVQLEMALTPDTVKGTGCYGHVSGVQVPENI